MKSKIDVLLLNASQWLGIRKPGYYRRMESIYYPLGPGYVGAMLKRNGVKSQILDLNMEKWDDQKLRQYISDLNPEYIGISSMSSNFINAMRTLNVVKRELPKTTVICGGIHASLLPTMILDRCRDIDYVLAGEAEFSFPNLIDKLSNGGSLDAVAGLYRRGNGGVIASKKHELPLNLDDIAFPDYGLSYTPAEKYFRYTYPEGIASIISTRGCPHKCPYCSTVEFHKRKYRARSVDSVSNEINYLKNQFGISRISFIDDSFASDHKRLNGICELMKGEHAELGWGCSCRFGDVGIEIIDQMSNAGCTDIFMGIESLSDKIQDQIRKKIDEKRLVEMIDFAHSRKVGLILAFMVGFPDEEKDDRRRIINFMRKYANKVKSWRYSPLIVYPGTEYFNESEKYGIDLSKYDALYPVSLGKNYCKNSTFTDIITDVVQMNRIYAEKFMRDGKYHEIIPPAIKVQ